MKKLDKTKTFGVVHGGGVIAYEQDGLSFDIFENEISAKKSKQIKEQVDNESIDATGGIEN